MAQPILPIARPLLLGDELVKRDRGKVALLGGFHGISASSFPHSHAQMVVVAHLSGGLGDINTYIDVRHAATGRLATHRRQESSISQIVKC